MASLTIRNLYKSFGPVQVLRGVNLEAQPGEFIALVGPSGCGKSTLLAMIAGLESISSGEIFIGDRLVNQMPPKDRDIAMVFQSYALYPTMSVQENITFGMESRNIPRDIQAQALARVAQLLQIEPLLKRKPAQLSGGQRQRVAMGRALVRDPALFLFDEPLSNLDAKLRVEMRSEIKKLHQRVGKTTVYVTHDQVEAMTLADRIALLNRGGVEQVGPPEELYRRPGTLFCARFFGSPEMNAIPGVVETHTGRAWFRGAGFVVELPAAASSLPPGACTLGARAEDLRVVARDGHEAHGHARVEVLENLGWDTLVHVAAGADAAGAAPLPLVLRVESTKAPRPGEVIGLRLEMAPLHLYAPSGARLVG